MQQQNKSGSYFKLMTNSCNLKYNNIPKLKVIAPMYQLSSLKKKEINKIPGNNLSLSEKKIGYKNVYGKLDLSNLKKLMDLSGIKTTNYEETNDNSVFALGKSDKSVENTINSYKLGGSNKYQKYGNNAYNIQNKISQLHNRCMLLIYNYYR